MQQKEHTATYQSLFSWLKYHTSVRSLVLEAGADRSPTARPQGTPRQPKRCLRAALPRVRCSPACARWSTAAGASPCQPCTASTGRNSCILTWLIKVWKNWPILLHSTNIYKETRLVSYCCTRLQNERMNYCWTASTSIKCIICSLHWSTRKSTTPCATLLKISKAPLLTWLKCGKTDHPCKTPA